MTSTAMSTNHLQFSGDALPEDSGFLEGTDYSVTEEGSNSGPPDFGTMERICSCPGPIYIRKSLPYNNPEERKGPCNMAPTYCDQCYGLKAGPADNPLCQLGKGSRQCLTCEGKGFLPDVDPENNVIDDVIKQDNDNDQHNSDQLDTPDLTTANPPKRCSDCFGRGVAVVIGADGVPLSPLSHTFEETNIRRLQTPYNVTMPAMAEEERRFCTYKVEYIMKDIFERKLKHVRYDPATCSRLSHDLCTMIKDKTKTMEFERYKLVVQVILGQDTEDSVQVASRCLWDQDSDNFAAATFRNSNLYAVGIVYGMHLD